jgi:predicted transcriptional regulator
MHVRDIAPYGVRMPAELKEKLQEIAKSNGRSLNSEIVMILEDHVKRNTMDLDSLRELDNDELHEIIKTQADLLIKYKEAIDNGFSVLNDVKRLLDSKK